MWTSDEVAQHLVQRSERWVLQRLRFSIPQRPHLLTNMVTGPIGGLVHLDKTPKTSTSKEFKELARVQARSSRRATGANIVFGQPAAPSSSTPPSKSSDNDLAPPPHCAASDDADLELEGEEVPIDVVFGEGAEQVEDRPDEVIEALAEAFVASADEADTARPPSGEATSGSTTGEIGAIDEKPAAGEVAGSSADAPQRGPATSASVETPVAVAPPPPAVPPPADGSDITDPSGLKYMYRASRSICRINPTKQNTAVR